MCTCSELRSRCRRLSVLFALAAQVVTTQSTEATPSFAQGCCFSIGYGSMMKPCCLSRSDKNFEDCFTSGNIDSMLSNPPTGKFQDGLVALGSTVGGDRGWRESCPSTADEAAEMIAADKEKANPFSAALGQLMVDTITPTPAPTESLLEAASPSKKPISVYDLEPKTPQVKKAIEEEKRASDQIHEGLPTWGWVLSLSSMALAVCVGIAQVVSERRGKSAKLHNIQGSADVELAKQVIRRVEASHEEARGLLSPQTQASSSSSPARFPTALQAPVLYSARAAPA